ncbi:exonuclease domain-containing protein [Phaeocystidibacter marisrubri]|uniref:DNA polymerase III subunit epsilon n=1 Tax=Phaeocystidibacter marisrubri TaxID=1577780 RepID=A0A6L3ZIL0_9FLAO|nr:exonuclease domain-containing protein [Phaeocystidibacter marisrubri]KAB2817734.1 DNA polymerase III subunit epsilon [Phaeocystidibacter marisrubri]GGH73853.1 exonuclease [Phaeocystidibacter marisrubri]
MFAIVDVETTGGYSDNHRVIEVGIAISDGTQITERFNALVNPGRTIPAHITQLTGISNADIEGAPPFSEIAAKVYDLLQGQVFVAHNVNFDFTFIKRELEEVGYTWNAKKLCTVRLSRKIFPGLKSYSLGNLASHFQIVNPNPHRALADAETAADILHLLLKEDETEVNSQLNKNRGTSQLPIHLDANVFHSLPETPGVYYMKSEKGENLYIGKAINIKQRISQHFTGSSGEKRRQRWLREIHDIKYIETGSEGLALLHEDHEIRHYWPPYNAAQKHPVAKWGIVSYKDRKGVPRLAVQRAEKRIDILEHFYSFTSAQQFLGELVRELELHPKLSGLGWDSDVEIELHTERLNAWLDQRKKESEVNGYLKFDGPDASVGYVLIENGGYSGIGTVSLGIEKWTLSLLKENLWHYHESPTARQILNALLRDHPLHSFDIE